MHLFFELTIMSFNYPIILSFLLKSAGNKVVRLMGQGQKLSHSKEGKIKPIVPII